MNARQFLNAFGRAEAERVAKAAGTNMAYFEQIACGARRPSFDLAERLAAQSDGRLDTLSLLRAKSTNGTKKKSPPPNTTAKAPAG